MTTTLIVSLVIIGLPVLLIRAAIKGHNNIQEYNRQFVAQQEAATEEAAKIMEEAANLPKSIDTKKKTFLKALSKGTSIGVACKLADIKASTLRDWCQNRAFNKAN